MGVPILKVPPIISGTGKTTIFKFCTHIRRIDRDKSPYNISGKVARDSQKFSEHPYTSVFAVAQLSCYYLGHYNKSHAIAGTAARCAVNFEAGSDCAMAQVPPSTNTRRRPLWI